MQLTTREYKSTSLCNIKKGQDNIDRNDTQNTENGLSLRTGSAREHLLISLVQRGNKVFIVLQTDHAMNKINTPLF